MGSLAWPKSHVLFEQSPQTCWVEASELEVGCKGVGGPEDNFRRIRVLLDGIYVALVCTLGVWGEG